MTHWNKIKQMFFNSYDKHNAELIDMINLIDKNHPEVITFINSRQGTIEYLEEALAILRYLYNNFWYESNRPLVIGGNNDNN